MAYDYTKTKKISDFAATGGIAGSDKFLIDVGSDYNTVTYTVLASNFASSSQGVTNGNAHDHAGGDGAQIDHTSLSNKGSNTHAQIDAHMANVSNPHSVGASDVGNTVAQWNADSLQGRDVATASPSDSQVLSWSVATSDWRPRSVSESDEKAKVSSNDTTAGYLNGKLVAGTNVTITEVDDGGNETLQINATGGGTDEKSKVSSNDTTAGYLNGKLVAGTNVTITEVDDGGNETLQINATGGGTGSGTDEKAKVSSNDTTAGYLNGKLVAGTNVTITEVDDGGNETLQINATGGGTGSGTDEKAKVSSNDTTAGYLNGKLVAGTNVTITEVDDGGNETLQINATGGGTGTGITWEEVTGTSQAFSGDSGYIPKNGALTTFTLPASGVVGETYRVAGFGSGGWKIAQNAGQSIRFGSSVTTEGAGGYIQSNNRSDSIEMLCVDGSNVFSVISAVGNITVV